jgi:hypothetical protein
MQAGSWHGACCSPHTGDTGQDGEALGANSGMPLTTGKAGLLRQQAKESESTVLHGGVEKHQEQADKQGC